MGSPQPPDSSTWEHKGLARDPGEESSQCGCVMRGLEEGRGQRTDEQCGLRSAVWPKPGAGGCSPANATVAGGEGGCTAGWEGGGGHPTTQLHLVIACYEASSKHVADRTRRNSLPSLTGVGHLFLPLPTQASK